MLVLRNSCTYMHLFIHLAVQLTEQTGCQVPCHFTEYRILEISRESNGSYEVDMFTPRAPPPNVTAVHNKYDPLTEEEVSQSSRLINLFYSFMLDGKPGKQLGEFEGWLPFAGKVN